MVFDPLDYPLTYQPPPMLSMQSAWIGHIPFAFTIVQAMRPRTLVELGTHPGDSYSAFCQAVLLGGTGTRCTAIDTWKSGTQTDKDSAEILQRLHAFHDPRFRAFSTLLQSDFDAARPRFADRSIDLLHIDGHPTYDAASEIFNGWLPKMSERGVILIHGTAIREKDAGVWKLWEELAPHYPNFQFGHGSGLGVLGVGKHQDPSMTRLFGSTPEWAKAIRAFYEMMDHRIQLIQSSHLCIQNAQHQSTVLLEINRRTGGPDIDIPKEAFDGPMPAAKAMTYLVNRLRSRIP